MIDNYRNLDFEVYVHLHDLQNILSHYEVEGESYEQIYECMELIRTKRYRVAVIGEFSRGKSSLLNALLGSRVLPVDITPTTATINRITFDLEPRVELKSRDGESSTIDINELENHVTKLTEQSEDIAGKILEAVIYYPTVICQNNIDLIDTPGLNEDEKMTELTVSQLQKIDAAIVLVSALSPVDQIEQGLIASLIESPEIDCVIFVVSFIDCVDEDDRERVIDLIKKRIAGVSATLEDQYGAEHAITQKARRLLLHPELYEVSASQALKAMETNSSSMLKKSGFPYFQKELYRILTSNQSSNAVVKSLRMMLQAGGHLDQWYAEKRKVLSDILDKNLAFQKQILDYYAECTQINNEVKRKYVKAVHEYIDRDSLIEEYRSLCILGLAEIKENTKETILNKIYEINDRINECTLAVLKASETQIKHAASECLDELAETRKESLIRAVEEFDSSETEALDKVIADAKAALDAFVMPDLERYNFFNPENLVSGSYLLSNRELQNTYQFILSDVRHCNYIYYMLEQTCKYGDSVVEFLGRCITDVTDLVNLVENGDRALQTHLFNMAEQAVKESRTDFVVNEKLYDKHKEELAELADYSEEIIKVLQEGSLNG